jgi:hypothetical protein
VLVVQQAPLLAVAEAEALLSQEDQLMLLTPAALAEVAADNRELIQQVRQAVTAEGTLLLRLRQVAASAELKTQMGALPL